MFGGGGNFGGSAEGRPHFPGFSYPARYGFGGSISRSAQSGCDRDGSHSPQGSDQCPPSLPGSAASSPSDGAQADMQLLAANDLHLHRLRVANHRRDLPIARPPMYPPGPLARPPGPVGSYMQVDEDMRRNIMLKVGLTFQLMNSPAVPISQSMKNPPCPPFAAISGFNQQHGPCTSCP